MIIRSGKTTRCLVVSGIHSPTPTQVACGDSVSITIENERDRVFDEYVLSVEKALDMARELTSCALATLNRQKGRNV